MAGQGERDVAVTLADARGRPLLRVDSLLPPGAPWPDEEVHWVAESAAELRLALTLLAGPGGDCPLRVAARPAAAADRARARAEAALAAGHARRRSGRPASCRAGIAPYRQAERAFAGLGLPGRRAEALLGLGLLHKDCLGDPAAALPALTSALPLFGAAGAPAEPAGAMIRHHLGEIRFAQGDLDGAIGEYGRALDLRRRLGRRADEALTANNLGHALHLQGRYDDAATSFDRALDLWGEDGDPRERGTTRLNRGQLHRELGQTAQARARFEEALALFRRAGDRGREAAALNALGLLALQEERPAAALAPLRRALALRAPGSRGRAVTLATLGKVYQQLGRRDEARRAYGEARRILPRAGDLRGEAQVVGNLGWLEAGAGADGRRALAHFERARELFAALADPSGVAWSLRGRAEVLRREGRLAEARAALEEALAAVERRRSGQTALATRAAYFASHQDSYDLLIDLLMEMHRREPGAGHAAAALGVNERALARSLLDGLAGSGVRAPAGGGSPGLLARERGLEREIAALVDRQTRLADQEAVDPAAVAAPLGAVEAALAARWDELERVRAALRAGDPRYASLTQPRPAGAAEIQGLLDRDTLLLEYRLGEERSFLWAVTPGSLAAFELPGRAALEAPVRRAAGLLARSRSRKAEVSARRQLAGLSALLLAPAAHLLPGKRLLVVGDGALQTLPFAALPEPGPGGDGAPLVARHEVVSLPSASVVAVLRREAGRRPPAPRTLWVLADPDFGGRYPALPHTRLEAAAILGLAPASSRAVQGRQAGRAAVLGEDLRDYRLLHFATHGRFAAGEPGGGRLVLAQVDPRGRPDPGGFLHLADIYRLDLRAELVVLSACRSALGREVRGEGMTGMTRGFFYAGAERVLVSLWNVNDRVTAELMRHFYRGLLVEGLAPAAALRAAQNAIRGEPRWRSPYYWAGFTLQGEWRPDEAGPPGS